MISQFCPALVSLPQDLPDSFREGESFAAEMDHLDCILSGWPLQYFIHCGQSLLNSLRFFNRVSLFLIFINFLGATPDTGGVGHCKQTETMLTAGLSNVVLLVVALCTRAFFRGHTGDRISDLRWSPTIISCRLNSARGKERNKIRSN